MALVYVGPGPWGPGQGAPLSRPQHDGNVYELATGIAALQAALAAHKSVVDITSSGNIVTFEFSDTTTVDIAFELPELNPRGEWLNNTAYAYPDIVTKQNFGVYLVKVPHLTPEAPEGFDPNAVESDTDGEPEKLYQLLVPFQDLRGLLHYVSDTFPADQELNTYDVFRDTSFGVFMVLHDHLAASTFDPNAVGETDEGALYLQLAPPAFAPVETVADTSYEVSLLDVGKYLRFTDPAGCAVFFPDEVALPVNAEIHFEQVGGDITFTSGTDITILPQRQDFDTNTNYEGAVVTAKSVAANTIKLIGPPGDPFDTDTA